ncbi:hypothetical protein B6U46_08135 [Ligilactobacillus salivarius]|uniref:Uncharacterized protein n=3 Tax=Ligilactobacillus salivarius TaxID=1624 RepID=A0A1V9SKE9_9LACO|nr:hypothetical protein [Ligilactobacillus salivarius]ABE00715.1 Hypothetical membrane spanning protein [Ligilactobacillus salivarius UCC118]OQQ73217.1 hypothetical protein B6U64_09415 [Ligilactobacillus salivarius]OQQ82472.1 hypothetical protein B6U58_09215 [Ligilactobacillus salivarius]OQR05812.1 hypothetical protein B6U47_09515 [Ligilactobacillus salivarius]OQR06266.1 hypothetical protein B6U46_08135 [Ligilactobacillus salivarius]
MFIDIGGENDMVETGIIILLIVGFMAISRLKVNFTRNSKYAGFLLLILLNLNGLMRTPMLTMRSLILLGTLMIFVVMLIKEIRQSRKYS